MKLLYVGDLHLRGTNPRNRLDNYRDAVTEKIREIFDLAQQHKVKAIITPGDVLDRPEVADSVKSYYADLLDETPVRIYTCPGNHDIRGYNLETYQGGSLSIIARMVPNLTVITDTEAFIWLEEDGQEVALTFTPYSGKMDIDGWGYSPDAVLPTGVFSIHVAHGMLLDHVPPFDRYSLVQKVQTTADLVFTGHDHTGYGLYRRPDGKVFCNPGSPTRIAASVAEMERPIQVALVDIKDAQAKDFTVDLIQLRTAKPGVEVLDRSKIEEAQARAYAMEEFAALIQASTGEKVLLDINQIVETIAAQEKIASEVVALTLKKIEEMRVAA